MRRIHRSLLAIVSAAALTLGACASDEPADEGAGKGPAAGEETVGGPATVFAASSLTESFGTIAESFQAANPEAEVTFNFGPSSGLATQIIEQGGADAFASADQANMAKVGDAQGIDGDAEVFARNRLQIIVAKGNPKAVRTLADLAKPDLKVVLAAPQVPVGRYGAEALDKAGVTVRPVSEAVDVKGVVGPVTLGEADAGIVYATDVQAAGDRAQGVEIPEEHNVVAEYPIAVIRDSPNKAVARAFVDFVLSDEGQAILEDHGFLPPE